MRENVIYGYARCSTSEELQDIKRQKRELKKLGVEDEKNIYFEYISGTERKRDELEKLMSIVQKNDTIVVTEVSRLTRSTSHLCEILEWIKINKLCLVIDTFKVDCRGEIIDPLTKGMLMMWGVFAEMERDIISQRVKSGIENAKEKGVKLGRPATKKDTIPKEFLRYYPDYLSGKINKKELASLTGFSRPTIQKYEKIIHQND